MVRFVRSLFGALMLCFISSGFAQSSSPTLKVLFSFPCTVHHPGACTALDGNVRQLSSPRSDR
jgi:hypothetical protein